MIIHVQKKFINLYIVSLIILNKKNYFRFFVIRLILEKIETRIFIIWFLLYKKKRRDAPAPLHPPLNISASGQPGYALPCSLLSSHQETGPGEHGSAGFFFCHEGSIIGRDEFGFFAAAFQDPFQQDVPVSIESFGH